MKKNEETTKITLILPFLKIMGYDTEDQSVFKSEYTASSGIKSTEKVDIAILNDDNEVEINN